MKTSVLHITNRLPLGTQCPSESGCGQAKVISDL